MDIIRLSFDRFTDLSLCIIDFRFDEVNPQIKTLLLGCNHLLFSFTPSVKESRHQPSFSRIHYTLWSTQLRENEVTFLFAPQSDIMC